MAHEMLLRCQYVAKFKLVVLGLGAVPVWQQQRVGDLLV